MERKVDREQVKKSNQRCRNYCNNQRVSLKHIDMDKCMSNCLKSIINEPDILIMSETELRSLISETEKKVLKQEKLMESDRYVQ